MATIVITSSPSSSMQRMTVVSLYSLGRGSRNSDRDTIDLIVDVLKSVVQHCRKGAIRTAAKIYKYALVKVCLAILCRYGMVTEVSVTQKNRTRSKKTGKRETSTINRYYVTPKGHALIHIYDIICEELTTMTSSSSGS